MERRKGVWGCRPLKMDWAQWPFGGGAATGGCGPTTPPTFELPSLDHVCVVEYVPEDRVGELGL
jgi:hypothetical protein